MLIKRKVTFLMMGISFSAVFLTVLAITTYLIYDMRDSKEKELGVTAALTADRNGAALMFADADHANRNMEIFRLNPSVMATCIYDAHGGLFVGYQAENKEHMVKCPPQVTEVQKEIPGMLTAFQNIHQNAQGGDVIGNIFMAEDTREIDAYVNKILWISLTSIILVLAVTSLLTVYFQRTISGPILELADTVQSITARRDYTLEAKASYQDETGILARAFNNMLSEVRKRDRELMMANETAEQKVIERTLQLETAMHKAEAASEAKSEFLRNMSHEFRTPLHAVISFAAYGIKEYSTATPTKLKHYFEYILQGSERLSRLVNEVLDLAKLEHGELKLKLQSVDMRELTARSAEMVQPLLAEKGIGLSFTNPAEPIITMCDHDKIMQVITNLLGNAIKFTPNGRKITLSTSVVDVDGEKQAVVAAIDEGVGIPEEEKEMIFQSFKQSSRTNTGAGGTGLGLAICRGIIQAHGGAIWAENNTDGPGARVTFSVPVNPKMVKSQSNEEEAHGNAA